MSLHLKYKGPVVLAILDGFGLKADPVGNAVKLAHTEFLNDAVMKYQSIALNASGEAVGLPPKTMGNSEVGHNAIGSGQIIKHGVAAIDAAFLSGDIWRSDAWATAIARAVSGHTLHFAGIFSDGAVHSTLRHLEAMIRQAHKEGVTKIRVHAVLDGRDVSPQSADRYLAEFTDFLNSFDEMDYRLASGGGRMVFVADRYENDWNVVRAGYDAMVYGRAEHQFPDALTAVQTFRANDPALQDQYIPPFVIVDNDQPVGRIENGDSLIYFDFRADRAIEIAQAFTYNDFPYFDRTADGAETRPTDVYFAGMTEYNSDTHVPAHRLVEPIEIKDTLNTVISKAGKTQLAAAETVKFGHITYYFNGNSYEAPAGEDHLEIPSDTLPFDTRPWMKSAETVDAVLPKLEQYDFVRINFAGADMVGHFAELEPTILAIEAIDLQLARLARTVDRLGGMLLITADHGNSEELLDEAGHSKTSHTTNPVPLIIYDNTENRLKYRLGNSLVGSAGLANLAATLADFLDLPDRPDSWLPSLIIANE